MRALTLGGHHDVAMAGEIPVARLASQGKWTYTNYIGIGEGQSKANLAWHELAGSQGFYFAPI